MTVVCSWCRQEGRHGVVREKAPFEDRRETHGICLAHRSQVRVGWENPGFLTRVHRRLWRHQSNGLVARSVSHLVNCLKQFSSRAGR